MKILAVIPARAGSKRLPNKNKLMLGDKPLIAWSIESAKGIPQICDILVSTDDPGIAEISRIHGALVPWLRPPELATDQSHVVDTLIHALDWYENNVTKVEGILLLQPTSPFRSKKSIQEGINLYLANKAKKSIVSVSKARIHPDWYFYLGEGKELIPMIKEEGYLKRSQDLKQVFHLNGNIYICPPEILRQTMTVFSQPSIGLVINHMTESIDIDEKIDFEIAEILVKKVES